MADIKPLKLHSSGDYSQFGTGDTIAIAHGGTGATSKETALTNLGAQTQHAYLDDIAALSDLAKGDIIVFNGSDLTKLSAGDNGKVLSYNSSTATGLEAVAVAGTPESTIEAGNGGVGAITRGQPVYMASDGDVELARANSTSTSVLVGFVQDASIDAAASGVIQTDGIITNETEDWDAITGGSGGLVPGTVYFISTATAGSLTSTLPTGAGNVVAPVLLGVSSTAGMILHRPRTILT